MSLCLTLALALIGADVARCESSARYDDGAVVLRVALNRARDWRRPLWRVLTQPRQFAHFCPLQARPFSWRHVQLGWAMARGTLQAPAWSLEARFYCGPSDTQERCHKRRYGAAGAIVHVFYRGSR